MNRVEQNEMFLDLERKFRRKGEVFDNVYFCKDNKSEILDLKNEFNNYFDNCISYFNNLENLEKDKPGVLDFLNSLTQKHYELDNLLFDFVNKYPNCNLFAKDIISFTDRIGNYLNAEELKKFKEYFYE